MLLLLHIYIAISLCTSRWRAELKEKNSVVYPARVSVWVVRICKSKKKLVVTALKAAHSSLLTANTFILIIFILSLFFKRQRSVLEPLFVLFFLCRSYHLFIQNGIFTCTKIVANPFDFFSFNTLINLIQQHSALFTFEKV